MKATDVSKKANDEKQGCFERIKKMMKYNNTFLE